MTSGPAPRPRQVTIAAWICMLAGAGGAVLMLPLILYAGALIAPGPPSTSGPLVADLVALLFFVLVPLGLFVALGVVGFKLLAGRRWARNVGLCLLLVFILLAGSGFVSLVSLLMVIVALYVAWALLSSWRWFEVPRPSRPPVSPQ